MNNKINIIVVGDKNKEHFTYVEKDGVYYSFYFDGYDGTSSDMIISFLKFLGHDVFILYKNKLDKPLECVNWRDYI